MQGEVKPLFELTNKQPKRYLVDMFQRYKVVICLMWLCNEYQLGPHKKGVNDTEDEPVTTATYLILNSEAEGTT